MTQSEPLPSSPSTTILPNRTSSTSASTSTPSNGSIPKTSQQTPVLQPRAQSPSTVLPDQSLTPLSPKATNIGVASLREQFDSAESSPSIATTKTPTRAKSPASAVPIEHAIRSTITPSKTTPVKETSPPAPAITPKTEETPKSIASIPKFYFPHGQIPTASSTDVLLGKQLRQAKEELFVPKHDKLHLEDFGRLAQVGSISMLVIFIDLI